MHSGVLNGACPGVRTRLSRPYLARDPLRNQVGCTQCVRPFEQLFNRPRYSTIAESIGCRCRQRIASRRNERGALAAASGASVLLSLVYRLGEYEWARLHAPPESLFQPWVGDGVNIDQFLHAWIIERRQNGIIR